jgi:hypothetical protein
MAWGGMLLQRWRRVMVSGAAVLACCAGAWGAEGDGGPWPAEVADWTPVAPNEHPRLFFRRGDLPELRRRAASPEGKAIVDRLRKTLGGGEAMCEHYSSAEHAYDKDAEHHFHNLPEGAYTVSHAAGFGMLYQLTGDKKYARLGRRCFEKAFAGQRDRDDRYSWTRPGGQLRAGPSLAWYALGYDLCFDGWEPAYRRKIARAIQTYDQGGRCTLARMVRRTRLHPRSNHWGSIIGGSGLAVLAIRGDDGTDDELLDGYLKTIERKAILAMTRGFGDGGYFWEHAGPTHVAANTAFVPFLQAMKVSAGKDYITPRPNAQWITMRWVHELLPVNGRPWHPCRHPSSYGREDLLWKDGSGGMSGGGWFSQGFGAVTAEQRRALLWTYENFVADAHEHRYDTVNYPHRAVLALVNWPIDEQPLHPSEVLPRARQDTVHRYFVFRNRWKDQNDTIVTALLGARGGSEPPLVWGLGMRLTFPLRLLKVRKVDFYPETDGSGVVAMHLRPASSFGVDYSGHSGAEAVVVFSGRFRGRVREKTHKGPDGATAVVSQVDSGNRQFVVMTLQRGPAPEVVALDGPEPAIRVGDQRVHFDGERLVFDRE